MAQERTDCSRNRSRGKINRVTLRRPPINARIFSFSILLFAFLYPIAVRAQWGTNGVVLSGGINDQTMPQAIFDGSGGAIVTWVDPRSLEYDICAQRVNAAGMAQWTANGVIVRSSTAPQTAPRIVTDNAGGAVIVWVDKNNGNDIHAQSITATGLLRWGSDGVVVCGASNDQTQISAVPDGAGGAMVVWMDARSGSSATADIYLQHVQSDGSVLPFDGRPVCTAALQQSFPVLVNDGGSGAIIAWTDLRSGTRDIYAQHVTSSGSALWTADGVPVCSAAGDQDRAAAAGDGAGGATIVWTDGRTSLNTIYAQHVDGLGAMDWAADGVPLGDGSSIQVDPQIVSDNGTSVVTWTDTRGSSGKDIYAQAMDGNGAWLWDVGGQAVCNAINDQSVARPVEVGGGAVVVTWMDARSGSPNTDIYAQRLSAIGIRQWQAGGLAVCAAADVQTGATTVSDAAGGVIVAWQDKRSGSDYDVYVNRVGANGNIPTAVGRTPATPLITVSDAYPNPFSAGTALNVSLPRAATVNVDILDVAGRRVRSLDLGSMAAGTTRIEFDGRNRDATLLPSGVYFCRIHTSNETVTRKLIIQH